MLDEPGLNIIGKIYESALDCAGWDDTLEAMADYCGGENVALAVIDQHTGYSTITAPRADPAIIAAYTNSWWQFDPTVKATAAIAVGQVTSLDDTGREHFLTSAFHNEFWKQSGLGAERLASNLSVCGNFFASAVLQTSPKRDRIDAEMDLRFRQFVPHLIRSVEMANRYRSLQYENLLGTPARGAPMGGRLVVDSAMHLIHADAGGEAFVAGSGCFNFRHGTVALVDRIANRKLAHAVEAVVNSSLVQSHHGSLSVVCAKTQKTVRIDVQPVLSAHLPLGLPFHAGSKPAAILNLGYVQDERQTSIDKLRTRFGLTPAEATVAFEMLTGDGREATAQRCGISINTARTHLTRIFDKTGVNRQAELVSVLNGYLSLQ